MSILLTNFQTSKRQSIIIWITGSLLSLLLLTFLAAIWWLWGWKWDSELTYHESWSAEERADLTEFDSYLRNDFSTDIAIQLQLEVLGEKGLHRDITLAYLARTFCAPVREQVALIAESGDAKQPTFEFMKKTGCTPAIVASISGHLGAVKAFIAHGADPNACINAGDEEDFIEGDTPITCVLSGDFINEKRKLPWSERKETADFLLAKGADLNAHGYIIGVNCSLELMRGKAEPWLWALEHGKKVNGREFVTCLTRDKLSLPVIEAMLHSTPGVANATDYGQTPLQALAQRICDAEAEEMPELEQVLDMLLAHGASPTQRPAPEEDYYTEERRLPLDILLEKQNFARCGTTADSCDGTTDDARSIWQRMCSKLQK